MDEVISDHEISDFIHRAPNLGKGEMQRFYIGVEGPLMRDFGFYQYCVFGPENVTEELARDLLHQTFFLVITEAYQNFKDIPGKKALSWVRGVGKNIWKRYLADLAEVKAPLFDEISVGVVDPKEPLDKAILNEIREDERKKKLDAAIARCYADQKKRKYIRVLVAFYYEDMSHKEIAKMLSGEEHREFSEVTSRTRLHRAHKILEEELRALEKERESSIDTAEQQKNEKKGGTNV